MGNETKDKAQSKLAKLLLVSYAMRKVSYMIRILAGGYLVYLMYQLFTESGASGEELTPVMIIGGLYAIINGIYDENDPAKLDAVESEDTPDDETPVEESATEE